MRILKLKVRILKLKVRILKLKVRILKLKVRILKLKVRILIFNLRFHFQSFIDDCLWYIDRINYHSTYLAETSTDPHCSGVP